MEITENHGKPMTNTKTIEKPNENAEKDRPRDRYNLVYIVIMFHGIGTLMPWNMFITPKSYFAEYKLGNASSGDFKYDSNFLSSLTLAAQIPNFLFAWLNVFIQFKGGMTPRVMWTLPMMAAVFVVTIILAMVDSSTWPGAFFWITMVSVVLLNMASGVYQNTVYGIGAILPPKYVGIIVFGSNISGTITSVISLISLITAPDEQTAAIYYFITALIVLFACFDTYFALPLNRFYRFYHEASKRGGAGGAGGAGGEVTPVVSKWEVLRKILPQCANVFLVYFVTLSLFPTVQSDIQKSDPDFFISDKYYNTVLCYLTFSVFASVGSVLHTWIKWPGPRLLSVAVWIRFLFIPLFLMCNYQPSGATRVLPVYIRSDWVYWALSVLMAVTSGHFSALGMMYCPGAVEPQHQSVAGMFGAAFLVSGIIFGIVFEFALQWFVTAVS